MTEDGSTTERMHLAALARLAEALTCLAGRLGARAVMSQDFIRLTARAKSIDAQAWTVRTSRWSFNENAARLADDLAALATDTQAAAARTVATVADDVGVINDLLAHAERIGRLQTGDSGSARQKAIRAELQPLETTLVTLRTRIDEERQVSNEAATLANEAADLATRALGLRQGGRAAEVAAQDIHAALIAFMEDATTVSRRIALSSQGLLEEAARVTPDPPDLRAHHIEGPRPGLVWTRVF